MNKLNTPTSSPWDNYDESQSARLIETDPVDEKKAVQTRKLVYAFTYMIDGHPNMKPLTQIDVEVPDEAYEKAMDDMAYDRITPSQKREFISQITPPTKDRRLGNDPISATMSRLDNPRERRILGYMTSGVSGFNNANNLQADSLQSFVNSEPTPMDFDQRSEAFLDMIERNNGSKKRATYEAAMDSFRHKVYGKQQEYWDIYKTLEGEARARRAAAENGYQDIHYPRSGKVD